MLVLAGVSLNAIVGDNGILNQAQQASLKSRFASYKEEAEMNYVSEYADAIVENRNVTPPTVMGEAIKKYITNLEDQDMDKFALIAGEFYYLGDNEGELNACASLGIQTRPVDVSQDDYVLAVESKGVEDLLQNMTGDSFLQTDDEGNTTEVGVALKDKGVGVANWKIIVEPQTDGTNITYGTDWYYVAAGNVVEGLGELKQSYIINYKERKAVMFNASKHTMLADGAGIAAGKDYLICNIDPSAIESGSSDFGDGVTFVGYDTDSSGNLVNAFTSSSFLFDGVDDHIRIQYDSAEEKQKLAENGFAFEFYGIWDDGTSYSDGDGYVTGSSILNNSGYKGLFSYWNGIARKQCSIRFGVQGKNMLKWSMLANNSKVSDFRERTLGWNILYKDVLTQGEEVYLTISVDFTDTEMKDGVLCCSQRCFVNGEEVYTGLYDISDLNRYRINDLPTLKYFLVGVSSMSYDNYWHYSKLDAYALRLYSKGLSPDEVKANYNATIAYHNILVNGGSAGTGGATGGTDF